ncbi:PE domain-containing protein [Mycobacterium sp. 4858]|uniref:PPE family protein, SVP subgroup n=1 Tax=Mycobacterium sp. 4858 TaxID=2057185 RepID=UPI000C84BC6A|nr:PE domain-containing protein [Mycobacterium sp. 4858]
MSFVITNPDALTYAAAKLETLGSEMAAENAAAAAPTTGVAPAAADEISALQAAIFDAYGTLYQSVSEQASSIHQQFVKTLGTSAGSYQTTEAANTAATASPFAAAPAIGSAASPAAAADPPPGSGLLNIGDIGIGNWGSATSDLLGMAGGGLLVRPDAVGPVAAAPSAATLASAPAPLTGAAAPTGSGATLGGVGQAAAVGRLSVPPSWAATAGAPAANPTATLTGAGWTAAAPHGPTTTALPAGVPSVATATRAGGLGAPRYGAKPTVMGRPTVV